MVATCRSNLSELASMDPSTLFFTINWMAAPTTATPRRDPGALISLNKGSANENYDPPPPHQRQQLLAGDVSVVHTRLACP
ncbi:hypothetical protein AAHC03_018997 [Spirometra sp. Aus1]